MEILRWTGRPSLALINRIGEGDHLADWRAALGQYFQIVRDFDAMHAPFDAHLSLLRGFGQLAPEWEAPLEEATHHLRDLFVRNTGEGRGEALLRVRPGALGVRIVGAPHQASVARVNPVVDADAIALKGDAALASEVVAR